MNSKILFTLLCTSLISISSFAKSDWRGKVVDEAGEPIAFANVVLLSQVDSSAVVGATTDDNGEYNIIGDQENLILMVAMLGYETAYLKPADNLLVTLKNQTEFLQAASVSVVMPKTKIAGEGLQTSIKGSILENIGTANDVLARTPGMIKDANGLKVIGRGAPLIYVNGRKLTDLSELDRILSSEIQSVEVISNPGAQYDATVTSVVRIKTVRRQGEGFGFNLNLSDEQSLEVANHNDPSASINMNFRKNDLDVFAGVNYWSFSTFQHSLLTKETFTSPKYYDDAKLDLDLIQKGYAFNGGVNYQISDNHSTGFKVEYTNHICDDQDQTIIDNVYKDGQLYENLISHGLVNNTLHPQTINANAYYNGSFGKLAVDFNANYYYGSNATVQNVEEKSSITADAKVKTYNEASNSMYAAKLVLSYPIWMGMLQAGTEDVYTKKSDAYSITGVEIPNAESEVNESNIAGFVTYSFGLPKFGQMSAGLRYENVHYLFEDKFSAENISRHYSNFFPSLSYSNAFGPVQTMLNFSTKTIRPKYSDLSTAMRYNSRYLIQSGNPKLQPQISTNLSLTTIWKFMALVADYTRVDGLISQWSEVFNDEGIILVSPQNFGRPFRQLSGFLNFTPTIGIWSLNYTVGFQNQWFKMDVPDSDNPGETKLYDMSGKPLILVQAFNTLRFKNDWQMELGANFYSKSNQINVELISHYFNLSAAIQKAFLADKSLIVRLSANDLLRRANNDIRGNFGDYVITQTNRMDTQKIELSIRYQFNTSKSKYRGTGAGKDNLDRMK